MNTAIGVKAIVGLLITSLALWPTRGAVALSDALDSQTITISVSGDLLVHHSLYEYALKAGGGKRYDFYSQLAPIKPLLKADINICHLETPLTSGEPSSYPVFSTPDSLARTIKSVGWDGCSLASNHSLDQGELGVYHTINSMQKAGLITSGTRLKQPERGELDTAIGWYEIYSDIQVAHLSYSFSTNGIKPKYTWLVNSPISTKAIIKDARKAKRYGADIVIVSIHAGTEYSITPNSQQLKIAQALTENSFIDAVVGHHSHVVQDAVIINGKPVIYGLGNLWSGQGLWSDRATSQFGALVTLKFSRKIASTPEEKFQYSGAKVSTVFTTPEGWQVLPAGQIPRNSRWGSAAILAIREVNGRLAAIKPIRGNRSQN